MFERVPFLEETIEQYADCLPGERISALDAEIRHHPEDYPDWREAIQEVREAEAAVRAALGDHQELLTTLIEAANRRDGLEEEYIYQLAFLDGGRVYHAFATHELPPQFSPRKEGSS